MPGCTTGRVRAVAPKLGVAAGSGAGVAGAVEGACAASGEGVAGASGAAGSADDGAAESGVLAASAASGEGAGCARATADVIDQATHTSETKPRLLTRTAVVGAARMPTRRAKG
jgi:hypothetical protein